MVSPTIIDTIDKSEVSLEVAIYHGKGANSIINLHSYGISNF